MSTYTIAPEDLKEGSNILVKGNINFARVSKVIDGEELVASDARKVMNGLKPVKRPHTTITLTNPEIVPMGQNLTTEEKFVQERFYKSKKHPELGLCYSIDNKSDRLPIVAKLNENGQAEQVALEGELASNQEVILVMRVYKPRDYDKRGLSLDQVIVQSTQIKYYGAAQNQDALAAAGIVYAKPVTQQVNNVPDTAAIPEETDQQTAWPTNTSEASSSHGNAPASNDDPLDTFRSKPASQPDNSNADNTADIEQLQKQLDEANKVAELQRQLAEAQAALNNQNPQQGSAFGSNNQNDNQPPAPISYKG